MIFATAVSFDIRMVNGKPQAKTRCWLRVYDRRLIKLDRIKKNGTKRSFDVRIENYFQSPLRSNYYIWRVRIEQRELGTTYKILWIWNSKNIWLQTEMVKKFMVEVLMSGSCEFTSGVALFLRNFLASRLGMSCYCARRPTLEVVNMRSREVNRVRKLKVGELPILTEFENPPCANSRIQ